MSVEHAHTVSVRGCTCAAELDAAVGAATALQPSAAPLGADDAPDAQPLPHQERKKESALGRGLRKPTGLGGTQRGPCPTSYHGRTNHRQGPGAPLGRFVLR